MTPCEQRGFKVGDNFVVGGGPEKGQEITLQHDDGSWIPLFKRRDGSSSYYLLSEVSKVDNMTPAQEKYLNEGDIVKVIALEGTSRFQDICKLGDRLRFHRDDGTTRPWFKTELGESVCPEVSSVELATPAELMGLKVGDEVEVIGNEDEGSDSLPFGTRLILSRDDGSECPYFTMKDRTGARVIPYLKNVRKVTEEGGIMSNLPENVEVESVNYMADGVEFGDMIVTRDGERHIVDTGFSKPDSDGDFSVRGGYINTRKIEGVYRFNTKPKEVEVTIKIPREDAEKIARQTLFTASDVQDCYIESYRESVANVINKVKESL